MKHGELTTAISGQCGHCSVGAWRRLWALAKNKKDETMKRNVSWITLGRLVASLLLGVFLGGRVDTISTVHGEEKEQRRSCSVATLNGAYGFFRTGTTPFGPLVAVGISTFDGSGASTGRQTIRRNGVTTSDLFANPAGAGIYEVDPDCAARFLMSDGTLMGHAVVVDGGKEILFMSLSDTNTIYGVMKKIDKE
jgi:hypothetical protein